MKSEAVITGNSEKLIFMKKKLKIKLKKNKRKKKQVAKRETLSCRGFQFRHSAREEEGLPLYRPSKKKVTVATFDSEIRIPDFAIEREIR